MAETESASGVSRRTFVASVMGAIGAVGAASAMPSAARADTLASPRAGHVDYFLRATGVAGDSTDRTYKDWVNVLDWSWGTLSNAPEPLTFASRSGRHTVALFGRAFDGKVIDKVELVGRSTTAGGELVKVTLTNAIVSQVSAESGEEFATETWGFPSYATVKLETRYVNSRGALTAWESMTWNVATGVVS